MAIKIGSSLFPGFEEQLKGIGTNPYSNYNALGSFNPQQIMSIGGDNATKDNGLMNWLGQGDNAKLALGGLNSLMGLIGGIGQYNLGKKQLKMQRDVFNTNLGNQIKDYNNTIAARASNAAWGSGESGNQSFIDQYVNDRKLEDKRI